MSVFDEIEIENMHYDEEDKTYYFPCPCGENFEISKEELLVGEEIATCFSCLQVIRVIYDKEALLAKEFEEILKMTRSGVCYQTLEDY